MPNSDVLSEADQERVSTFTDALATAICDIAEEQAVENLIRGVAVNVILEDSVNKIEVHLSI